jgi:hypothetical protein
MNHSFGGCWKWIVESRHLPTVFSKSQDEVV